MISNLEYYKVFYYVSKYNGITAAAKELSISHPAVSQSIHQLESILGCIIVYNFLDIYCLIGTV